MLQPLKAAWIALAIICVLTASKFGLYLLSGSISVLSEAWHSLMDIATTLLVLISIIRQGYKAKKQAATPTEAEDLPPTEKFSRMASTYRFYIWLRSINTELKISFCIAIILCFAALSILWKAITAETIDINQPLITGIVFIVLSFGSFFLYRFEASIGKDENSAALTADSHHNRADMVISLLTGASLITYYFGFDIDRIVGIFIAVYILSFASELLVNSVHSIAKNESNVVVKYRFHVIMTRFFDKQTYKDAFHWIDQRLGLGAYTKKVLRIIVRGANVVMRWALYIVIIAAILAYFSTMFYMVKPDEQALHLRFGRLSNDIQSPPVNPGLHLKLPYPIDTVVKFQTEKINSLSVGNTSSNTVAMIWTQEHGDNFTFISGDNNLFLPYAVVHYRIKNVRHFYMNHRDDTPEKVLRVSAIRLMSQIFTRNTFYDLILHKREVWTLDCQQKLQQAMDQLQTGLEIVDFCLLDIHPPTRLADAYETVVAAEQLRIKDLNDVKNFESSLLSDERINALRVVTNAQTDVSAKIKLAQGEAQNYLLRYSGFKEGGKTIRDLLLFETAEKTLKGKKIFLVDPDSGIEDQLIYIETYMMGNEEWQKLD